MSNPQADPYLYNYHKLGKNPDGSYNIGNVSRLSAIQKMELDMLKAEWIHTILPSSVRGDIGINPAIGKMPKLQENITVGEGKVKE